MQETSQLYKELLSGTHWCETRLAIGESGTLIDKSGDHITFGGHRILVATSGADSGYDESMLMTVETDSTVFSGSTPEVGGCVSREIDAKMLKPISKITGLSRMVPYLRLTDGERHSEWMQQGVYYLDTMRGIKSTDEGGHVYIKYLTLHGYDAMLFAEADYPENSSLSWPAKDIDVVREIATAMGVTVDARTVELMDKSYPVQYPVGYSQRETLGYIAAMYAGCFVMSETGELQLVCLWNIPAETRYLVDHTGYSITFGGNRILV